MCVSTNSFESVETKIHERILNSTEPFSGQGLNCKTSASSVCYLLPPNMCHAWWKQHLTSNAKAESVESKSRNDNCITTCWNDLRKTKATKITEQKSRGGIFSFFNRTTTQSGNVLTRASKRSMFLASKSKVSFFKTVNTIGKKTSQVKSNSERRNMA